MEKMKSVNLKNQNDNLKYKNVQTQQHASFLFHFELFIVTFRFDFSIFN